MVDKLKFRQVYYGIVILLNFIVLLLDSIGYDDVHEKEFWYDTVLRVANVAVGIFFCAIGRRLKHLSNIVSFMSMILNIGQSIYFLYYYNHNNFMLAIGILVCVIWNFEITSKIVYLLLYVNLRQTPRIQNITLIKSNKRCTEKITDPCPICLEEYQIDDFITTLQCDHFFHSDCIEKWMEKSQMCPYCRSGEVAV